MNVDLENVRKWLMKNRLSLNVKKSEFMVIGTPQRLARVEDSLDLRINGETIKRVNNCKHLGVIIDDTLSWNKHIDHITKKVAPGLFYLRKAKPLIPSKMQSLLYNAIISPHFNYCNVVWGNCNQSMHAKLQVLQNRAAKIICGVNQYASGTQAIKDLKGISHDLTWL